MKNKKPLLFMISITLLVALTIQSVNEYRNILLDDYARHIKRREAQIQNYIGLSRTLVQAKDIDAVQALLDQGRTSMHFDYYVIQYKGEPLAWGTADGQPDSVNHKFQTFDQMVVLPDKSFYVTQLGPNTTLMIGINKFVNDYISTSFGQDWKKIAQSLLFVCAIAVIVFLYYIRDILNVLRLFRRRNRGNYKDVRTHSREADLIVRGLDGYQQAVDKLVARNRVLDDQILPSLRSELNSGRKPPYKFQCAMVRIDLNNFTHIYNTYDRDVFGRVLRDFFFRTAHVIARYDGLEHEHAGDEVIFYFKDEHSPNSVLTALSALRDIDKIAEQIHAYTTENLGYGFIVKASISHGELECELRMRGVGLKGAPFIETDRILKQVDDKTRNVVYFVEDARSKLAPICESVEVKRASFRGYAEEKVLCGYTGHRNLDEILASLDEDSAEWLLYYRGDEDLLTTLSYLKSRWYELSDKTVLKTIRTLRNITVTLSDARVEHALLEWLEAMAQSPSLEKIANGYQILSAAIMLTMNLIPTNRFTEETEQRLAKFLDVGDRRVVANVFDVLAHFRTDEASETLAGIHRHKDNRIVANALIYEAKRDITPSIVKRLKQMLKAKAPEFRASALYAIGEIAAFHKTRDIVYFNTKVDFQMLVDQIPSLISDSDPMIRRQSFICARKISDEKLTARVLQAVEKSQQPNLRAEAETYLKNESLQRAA